MYHHIYTHTFPAGRRFKTIIFSITGTAFRCSRSYTPAGKPLAQFVVCFFFLRVAFNW